MSDPHVGIILLTVVAIAVGGAFLLRVVRGEVPTNDLQHSFYRAGHAHAGVLVMLGLVIELYLRDAGVPGRAQAMSGGVLLRAILMLLGFFLSVLGRDPERPNSLRWCIVAGGAGVVLDVLGAGLGLVLAG